MDQHRKEMVKSKKVGRVIPSDFFAAQDPAPEGRPHKICYRAIAVSRT